MDDFIERITRESEAKLRSQNIAEMKYIHSISSREQAVFAVHMVPIWMAQDSIF